MVFRLKNMLLPGYKLMAMHRNRIGKLLMKNQGGRE
jgi:hypothetical protein